MSEQPYDRLTVDQIRAMAAIDQIQSTAATCAVDQAAEGPVSPRKEGAITQALRELSTTVGNLEGEIAELASRIDPILKPASEKLTSPSQNEVSMPPKSPMEITVGDILREVQAVGRRLVALNNRIDL